jgi:hypothetical protein
MFTILRFVMIRALDSSAGRPISSAAVRRRSGPEIGRTVKSDPR